MSSLYPAYIRLDNRRCVVVGGGSVAERKVRSLLDCGALVTVISPLFCAGLLRLSDGNRIETIWREYRQGDLLGAFLVVAATDCEEINAAVAAEAEERGALVNVVDHPEKGNLLVPAVARRGDLAISISTAGRCPALAKELRAQLESALVPEYSLVLDLVAQVREDARLGGVRLDAGMWQDLLSSDIIELARRGLVKEARERLLIALSAVVGSSKQTPVDSEGGR